MIDLLVVSHACFMGINRNIYHLFEQDSWHTFDYTLIDFFLIDKLLEPGGFVAFYDMYAPSKQKVLSYILTHRKYKIETKYLVRGNESRWRTLKFFIWRILTHPILFFSYHWKFQLFNSSVQVY